MRRRPAALKLLNPGQHLAHQIVTSSAVVEASYPLQTQIHEGPYAIAQLHETIEDTQLRLKL